MLIGRIIFGQFVPDERPEWFSNPSTMPTTWSRAIQFPEILLLRQRVKELEAELASLKGTA